MEDESDGCAVTEDLPQVGRGWAEKRISLGVVASAEDAGTAATTTTTTGCAAPVVGNGVGEKSERGREGVEAKVSFIEPLGGGEAGHRGGTGGRPTVRGAGASWWKLLGISKKELVLSPKKVKAVAALLSPDASPVEHRTGGNSRSSSPVLDARPNTERKSPTAHKRRSVHAGSGSPGRGSGFLENNNEEHESNRGSGGGYGVGGRIPFGLRAGKEIGAGTFANVYTAKKKGSGQVVALKFIRHPTTHRLLSPRLLENDPFGLSVEPLSPRSASELRDVAVSARKEVEIHRSLDHPHVVLLQNYVLEIDYTALVIEYLPHCLFELVRREHVRVLPHIPAYQRHLLLALAYLHSVGVAHRDVKLENMLVSADRCGAKLCDFGLATFYSAGERSTEYCGSPHYAAPEILVGTPYDPAAADLWSAGVVLYAMAYAAMPFGQNGDSRLLLHSERSVHFPKHPLGAPTVLIPLEWRVCAEKMLNKTPTHRPTAAKLLADAWLSPFSLPSFS